MISEARVVYAYRHMIRCQARYLQLGGKETKEQRAERVEAIHQSNTLYMQYLAQQEDHAERNK